MRSALTLGVVCMFTTPCISQVKTTVTPPGFTKTEAGSFSNFVGSYPAARMQFLETFLNGKGAKSIKKVGYRLDDLTVPLAGRNWRSVTLDCAETRYSAISSTFSKNALTTPVRVFSTAVSWPAVGLWRTSPMPFTSTYAFPFKTVFPYSGKNDALLDFRFSGGVLANTATWRTNVGELHFFDSPVSLPYIRALINTVPPRPASSCTDSSHAYSARCMIELLVYSKNTGDPLTTNTLNFSITSDQTANGGPVVHALDLVGNSRGTTFNGISCTKLYLTGSPSLLLFFGTASPFDGVKKTDFGYIPWNPLYAGTSIWAQAVWNDSKTKSQMLSRASNAVVPKQPADQLARGCVYQLDPKLMLKSGKVTRDDWANPLIQWTH